MRVLIDRQERRLRRDGALVVLGAAGVTASSWYLDPPIGLAALRPLGGFLRGLSIGVVLAGVFRATDEQALRVSLWFGLGVAVGTLF